jgi:hypothetical protein
MLGTVALVTAWPGVGTASAHPVPSTGLVYPALPPIDLGAFFTPPFTVG